MKKRSIMLTLILALLLYGCGEQETAVNEVSSDAVAESDSSDITDEQAQEQMPSDELTEDDGKEEENADSDNSDQTETADENKDTDAESAAADNDTTDSETADNEETEEQLLPEYTVTAYDESQVMYAASAVNVRKGPSTDFERVGGLAYGQEVTVTGQADTEWYEIVYGEDKAYVSDKYLQNDKPADESQAAAEADPQAEPDAQSQTQQAASEIQPVTEVKNVAGVIFVGDSRFVQMQASVEANSCTWIAESSKGYTWFEEKAIPRIDGCVGSGSKILINLGVNDTRNVQKYITLVNAKAAEWTALGATVYYASVNPVWENPYVTEELVENFNTQMLSGLSSDVHWIDSHSYLTSVGYRLVDGLHYSTETYQTLYAYFMSCM
ncbi:MAG: SH3 domain-containing protein [Lachnospiraceae bacterium]|nr:SH3 domain-containing protein [Lachnospiraceae bacterium]